MAAEKSRKLSRSSFGIFGLSVVGQTCHIAPHVLIRLRQSEQDHPSRRAQMRATGKHSRQQPLGGKSKSVLRGAAFCASPWTLRTFIFLAKSYFEGADGVGATGGNFSSSYKNFAPIKTFPKSLRGFGESSPAAPRGAQFLPSAMFRDPAHLTHRP